MIQQITKLIVPTFSKMTLSILSLRITVPSIRRFSITTLSIMTKSIYKIQNNNTQHNKYPQNGSISSLSFTVNVIQNATCYTDMLWGVMLSVVLLKVVEPRQYRHKVKLIHFFLKMVSIKITLGSHHKSFDALNEFLTVVS